MNKTVIFLNHLDLDILDKDFYLSFFNTILNIKKEHEYALRTNESVLKPLNHEKRKSLNLTTNQKKKRYLNKHIKRITIKQNEKRLKI